MNDKIKNDFVLGPANLEPALRSYAPVKSITFNARFRKLMVISKFGLIQNGFHSKQIS